MLAQGSIDGCARASAGRMARPWVLACASMTFVVGIAGCATRPSVPPLHAATSSVRAPPASRSANTDRVKIGQPYFVTGHWYTPADDRAYDVTGIASWYGPGFHALATASGERYDQDGLSAAHKTLPLPSFVEVTNLDNGRVLTIRVNDRGPFVDGRIIDLSRKSAQLLGVDRPGTAHVRVRRVFPDTATVAALAPLPTQPLPPIAIAAAPVAVVEPGAVPGTIFIQVAALSDAGRAEWLKGFLITFAPTAVERSPGGLWRVRLGPFASAQAATPILARVQAAGYTDARTVVAAADR